MKKFSWQPKSVFKKNFLLTFILMFVFILIFSMIIGIQNQESIKKEILLIEQQKNTQTSNSVYLYLDQITRINNYFSTVVVKNIVYPIPESDISWYTGLNDRATICIALLNYIRGIRINNSEGLYIKEENSIIGIDEVLQSGTAKLGTINATDIYFNNNNQATCLYFNLSEADNVYAKNNVAISVDALNLGTDIFGSSGDDEFRCVVNKSGDIVLSNSFAVLQQKIYDIYDVGPDFIAMGDRVIKNEKKDYYLSVNQISNLDLYTISLTKSDVYNNYRISNLIKYGMFGMLLIGVFFVLSMIVVIHTYRPIKKLCLSLSSYFPEDYLSNSVDEISYIESRFLEMHSENRSKDLLIKNDMINLRNQQIRALQAQISPHFIYNTLDVINWVSYKQNGKDNSISNCIMNMADVLSSSMHFESMFSSLDNEIQITKKYIEILKIRYLSSFDVIWDVDEALLGAMVPKICIQPIIENAVFHGLSNVKENGIIKIKIYLKTENDLCIMIKDNGKGIAEEDLQKLQLVIDDIETMPSAHIGLRNVNLRLKLLYGKEYGVTLESRINEGSTCNLLLHYDSYNLGNH